MYSNNILLLTLLSLIAVPLQSHITPTRSLSELAEQLARLHHVEPLQSSPFRVLLRSAEENKFPFVTTFILFASCYNVDISPV
jgi:hypothetical protein